MRELKQEELAQVSGGVCMNDYMGITEPRPDQAL
jgi:bacteriocin-like protein